MKLKSNIHAVLLLCSMAAGLASCDGCKKPVPVPEEYTAVAPAFEADTAFAYVERQCAYGPRVTGSEAHAECGAWLSSEFTRLGAVVTEQKATFTLYDGTKVSGMNIVASYQPDLPDRIIVCAHWDSRPWADHDPDEQMHKTAIDGANDGASGVAVLLELARMMQKEAPQVGVDLICFDAEDCGTPDWAKDDANSESTWCLGSQYWAEHHHVEGYTANCAILLDMVGGSGTHFCKEGFSLRYAPQLCDRLWATAHRLGVGQYFSYDEGGFVTDDHLPVNRSGIPCVDIIGSDKTAGGFAPTWHTTEDNVRNIDRNVLAAVGRTVAELIYTASPL